MAVLAWPALEGAAMALLALLGIGVGTAVVTDEVKRRQRATEQAGTKPVATTASQTQTKSCSKCPPDCGILVQRNWNMSDVSATYQARVTGYTPGTEWSFGGLDFDGFQSAACLLQEAKAHYDQFLHEDSTGSVMPKPWYSAFQTSMIPQAMRQAGVARAAPPAKLTWYFKDPMTYTYMARKVMQYPPLLAIHLP